MQKPPDPAKLPGGVHNWLPTSDALKTHGVWKSSLASTHEQKEAPKRSSFEDVKISRSNVGGCKKCGLAGHLSSQCTNFLGGIGLIPDPPRKVKKEITKRKR